MPDRFDSEAIIASMPTKFDTVVDKCREDISTQANFGDRVHCINRITYLGVITYRVFCFVARVKDPIGYHWLAFLMVPRGGDINNELVAPCEWPVSLVLKADTFRRRLMELEPGFVEAVERDGILFTGPSQKSDTRSEPEPV